MVYAMVEHFLGFNSTRHNIGQYTRLAGVVLPIVAIALGIRDKRNNDLNGVMTFGQGVKAGVLIALMQTALTTLFFTLYGNVINPNFLDTLLEFERSKMIAAGMPQTEILSRVNQMRSMYSLPMQPIFQMIAGLLYGSVAATIFSAILKKKPASEVQGTLR